MNETSHAKDINLENLKKINLIISHKNFKIKSKKKLKIVSKQFKSEQVDGKKYCNRILKNLKVTRLKI